MEICCKFLNRGIECSLFFQSWKWKRQRRPGKWKFSQAELRNKVSSSSAIVFLALPDSGLVTRRHSPTRELRVVDVLTGVIKNFGRATETSNNYTSPSPASPLCERKQIKGVPVLKYKRVDIWHLPGLGCHWRALGFNLTVQGCLMNHLSLITWKSLQLLTHIRPYCWFSWLRRS